MAENVKKEGSEASEKDVLELVALVSDPSNKGSVKRGVNQVTKSIERGEAKIVVSATDVNPPAVTAHLGPLCTDKVPLLKVSSKDKLGAASGIQRPCAAIAIVNPGDTSNNELYLKLSKLKK